MKNLLQWHTAGTKRQWPCTQYALNLKSIGGIIFISDDKKHDMQQVHAFERRMFEILCSKIPHEINYWQRWADGCSGQFRSQFCNASCIRAKDDFGLQTVSWQYFEAHEGKNLSDTLGSIAKCEVKRQMAQYSHGVQTAADVVTLLHKGVSESTKSLTFSTLKNFHHWQESLQKSAILIQLKKL